MGRKTRNFSSSSKAGRMRVSSWSRRRVRVEGSSAWPLDWFPHPQVTKKVARISKRAAPRPRTHEAGLTT
jgi:hypothetical protein